MFRIKQIYKNCYAVEKSKFQELSIKKIKIHKKTNASDSYTPLNTDLSNRSSSPTLDPVIHLILHE
jgi:hypothetical protein